MEENKRDFQTQHIANSLCGFLLDSDNMGAGIRSKPYTGDYNANGFHQMKQLNNAYDKYNRYIGLLQIPHHGSKHSYNHELLSLGDHTVFVISSGEKSKYRHPHSSVVRDILATRKPFIWVTEHSGSIARFMVEW